jgi:uncharacterized membrane protein YeaQ/YmgE (transglycosylase-associated protein family)
MTLAMVAMRVVVGLLVGLLAGFVMKAGGYGRRWDVLLAVVGSIVGSGIAWLLEIPPDPGLVAVTLVAAVGAAGLVVAQRKIWPIIGVGGEGTLDGVGRAMAMTTANSGRPM